MIQSTAPYTLYLLPDDAPAAKARLLELLAGAAEVWCACYGFSDPDVLAALEALDAKGVPVHLLLDHTQSCGPTERAGVEKLAASLKHGDLTIGTAGAPSPVTGEILHTKMVSVRATDGTDWLVEGSTNLTMPGWTEGNSLTVTPCPVVSTAFREWFTAHRDWSRTHDARYQLQASPAPVTIGPTPGQ